MFLNLKVLRIMFIQALPEEPTRERIPVKHQQKGWSVSIDYISLQISEKMGGLE